jgi:predicted nucleic acid-binding protein
MDTVFLDANVLFSAAYEDDADFLRLWRLKGVRLVSSGYAAGEAERNLKRPGQRERLQKLLQSVEFISPVGDAPLPKGVRLPEKDAPILLGAIAARATHLLTGDAAHFGPYYGRIIEGVRVLSPAAYFDRRPL